MAERKVFDCPADGTLWLKLRFEPLPLRLRHVFGTSHSSSSTRTNALYTVEIGLRGTLDGRPLATGQGESGLPPKKPMCYHADVTDCAVFFDSFCEALQAAGGVNAAGDPFAGLAGFFRTHQHVFGTHSIGSDAAKAASRLFHHLLITADGFTEKQFLAGRAGLESAIFACWSAVWQLPVCVFAGIPAMPNPTRSFYTAALNDSLAEMEASTRFGLDYTPCIKIKLDGNVQRSEQILSHFAGNGLGAVWSIDANAGWDAATAMAHLPAIQQAAASGCVYMVEQPFPIGYRPGLAAEEDHKWQAFRAALNAIPSPNGAGKVLLYADESIANEEDVRLFAPMVDGVNIKLEKAGGIRASIKAVLAARALGLKVWIGTMVSSCLGCAASAHVACLADDSDVDGGLLVFPDVFDGGFRWRPDDGAILIDGLEQLRAAGPYSLPPEVWGFGVTPVAPPGSA